jgi:hypothetical protein
VIEPRVIREDLDPGPDDEGHEEEVQEVQNAQPHRVPGRDRRLEAPGSRIGLEEVLHPLVGAQLLAYRNENE